MGESSRYSMKINRMFVMHDTHSKKQTIILPLNSSLVFTAIRQIKYLNICALVKEKAKTNKYQQNKTKRKKKQTPQETGEREPFFIMYTVTCMNSDVQKPDFHQSCVTTRPRANGNDSRSNSKLRWTGEEGRKERIRSTDIFPKPKRFSPTKETALASEQKQPLSAMAHGHQDHS